VIGPTLPFVQVDAFTTEAFSGNSAAVFLLEGLLAEASMAVLAREMNLSESAFVGPPDADGFRSLRWFTPSTEVSLCGHATLASAHVLREAGVEPPYRFDSASGALGVHPEPDGSLYLDFPSDHPEPHAPPPGLLPSLGCDQAVVTEVGDRVWIVQVETEQQVRGLRPDYGLLRDVSLGPGRLGVTVTAPDAKGNGFVSRFFAPWVGIDEDPVTGVAHTALGPFWSSRLGHAEMAARQLSRRGGELRVRVNGDRVHLAGHCVTVAEGRVRIP